MATSKQFLESAAFCAVLSIGTFVIMTVPATQQPPQYALAIAAGVGTLLGAYTIFTFHPALRTDNAPSLANRWADELVKWIRGK